VLTLSLLGADSPSPHGSMWVVWFAPVVGLDGAPRVGARHSFAPNGFPLVGMERCGGNGRARGQSHEVDRDLCRAMPFPTSRARRVGVPVQLATGSGASRHLACPSRIV